MDFFQAHKSKIPKRNPYKSKITMNQVIKTEIKQVKANQFKDCKESICYGKNTTKQAPKSNQVEVTEVITND